VSQPPKDVLLVGPQTAADGHAVIRQREDRIELGEIRPMREGKPIAFGDAGVEIVRLRQRQEHERLFDVEVLGDLQADPTSRNGPVQVANDAYRQGWDLIFGDSDADN
jgi:hypothetical protein